MASNTSWLIETPKFWPPCAGFWYFSSSIFFEFKLITIQD
jgi:hypothetical protein